MHWHISVNMLCLWYSLMSNGSDDFSSLCIFACPRVFTFSQKFIFCMDLALYVCESQVEPGFLRLSYGATICSSVPLTKAILEPY